jgi:hypothetical protein
MSSACPTSLQHRKSSDGGRIAGSFLLPPRRRTYYVAFGKQREVDGSAPLYSASNTTHEGVARGLSSQPLPQLHRQRPASDGLLQGGVFGGTLTVNTFGEFGAQDTPEADKIMHAVLETDRGFTLMASDTPAGMEHNPGNNIAISLSRSWVLWRTRNRVFTTRPSSRHGRMAQAACHTAHTRRTRCR